MRADEPPKPDPVPEHQDAPSRRREGPRYVSWSEQHGCWRARVSVVVGQTVRRVSLGMYRSVDLAAAAIRRYLKEL